jgi:hypothetical protein
MLTDVVSPEPLSAAPSSCLAMKSPQRAEEDSDDPEPYPDGLFLWSLVNLKYRSSKNLG